MTGWSWFGSSGLGKPSNQVHKVALNECDRSMMNHSVFLELFKRWWLKMGTELAEDELVDQQDRI